MAAIFKSSLQNLSPPPTSVKVEPLAKPKTSLKFFVNTTKLKTKVLAGFGQNVETKVSTLSLTPSKTFREYRPWGGFHERSYPGLRLKLETSVSNYWHNLLEPMDSALMDFTKGLRCVFLSVLVHVYMCTYFVPNTKITSLNWQFLYCNTVNDQ